MENFYKPIVSRFEAGRRMSLDIINLAQGKCFSEIA